MATVTGYHACERGFAEKLKDGELTVAQWMPSNNDYDWLGHGIYFWEESLRRAREWASESVKGDSAVIEAEVNIGV